MTDINRLDPHAPLPDGPFVAVLRRFDEDDPRRVVLEMIHNSGGPEVTSRPQRDDGSFMEYEEAIAAASVLAEKSGLPSVTVIDRTAGPRERDILAHGGDHGVGMEDALDMDLEGGERGPTMADR